MRKSSGLIIWLLLFSLVFIWSVIEPHDYFTWFLEVFPAIIAIIVLWATYNKFPLTPLTYWLILAHAIVLMIGGHYTYANVPLFDWIQDHFNLSRNYYDKVGHFFQGFVPALIARELLLRKSPLTIGKWLFFIIVSICLAISAFYELIEWWVALLSGAGAEAFLGTQGDVWDTQSDMMLALIGAMSALFLLGKFQDKQLNALTKKSR
jgi:putative membrane protein